MVEIRHPRDDESRSVGNLLLATDPYIYPTLLGDSASATAVSRIMNLPGSPFAHDHVWVACDDGEVCGLMVAYVEQPSSKFDWSGLDVAALRLPDSFEDVCVRYLEPMLASVGDDAYVACLATASLHRNRGVATALLETLFDMVGDQAVSLDVLADNEPAIRLYSKLGFRPCGDVFLGYAHAVEDSPQVISMRRA